MTSQPLPPPSSRWQMLARKDVLAGSMFIAVAALGLFLSRHYPIGTALRMGTGYVPRLLCWILLGLGIIVLIRGLRMGEPMTGPPARWRPLVWIPVSLLAYALTISDFGLVVATLLLIGLGSLAGRDLRPIEVVVAALFLIAITFGIFVWGLGLPIQVWPDW